MTKSTSKYTFIALLMLRQACNYAASADQVSPRMRQSSVCTYTAQVVSTSQGRRRLLRVTGDGAGWPPQICALGLQGEIVTLLLSGRGPTLQLWPQLTGRPCNRFPCLPPAFRGPCTLSHSPSCILRCPVPLLTVQCPHAGGPGNGLPCGLQLHPAAGTHRDQHAPQAGGSSCWL